MATRTPPLQTRSQYHAYWGSYANAFDALPNQSGNVLSAAGGTDNLVVANRIGGTLTVAGTTPEVANNT